MTNRLESRIAPSVELAKKWDAMRPAKEPQGVYVFECEGYFKIGIASDPARRLITAQVNCPFPIRLVSFRLWDNAKEQEREMHHKLRAYHVRGEWFKAPLNEVVKLL